MQPPKGHDLDQGRDKGDLRQEIMDPVMGYYLQKVCEGVIQGSYGQIGASG